VRLRGVEPWLLVLQPFLYDVDSFSDFAGPFLTCMDSRMHKATRIGLRLVSSDLVVLDRESVK